MDTTTITNEAYGNTPLWNMSECARGLAIESIVRRWADATGQATHDSESGLRINGTTRGQNCAPYDFQQGEDRIEVKSSRLCWSLFHRRWAARWCWIKHNLHDHLYLALYTPTGIDVYLHNGTFGLSTNSGLTSEKGDVVQANGPKRNPCIDTAVTDIHAKMDSMFKVRINATKNRLSKR